MAKVKSSKRKKKFDLVKYIKQNKVNSAIAAVILLFVVVELWNYTQQGTEGSVVYPTATVPRHIPGKNYITSGEWTATQFGHDMGHSGVNGSWVSEKGGFGYMMAGMYIDILEGKYNVTFRMKIDNNTIKDSNKVVTIEVSASRGLPVVAKDLHIQDFAGSDVYQDFTLTLDTPDPLNDAEFRVHYDGKTPVTVTLEKVKFNPV